MEYEFYVDAITKERSQQLALLSRTWEFFGVVDNEKDLRQKIVACLLPFVSLISVGPSCINNPQLKHNVFSITGRTETELRQISYVAPKDDDSQLMLDEVVKEYNLQLVRAKYTKEP